MAFSSGPLRLATSDWVDSWQSGAGRRFDFRARGVFAVSHHGGDAPASGALVCPPAGGRDDEKKWPSAIFGPKSTRLLGGNQLLRQASSDSQLAACPGLMPADISGADVSGFVAGGEEGRGDASPLSAGHAPPGFADLGLRPWISMIRR